MRKALLLQLLLFLLPFFATAQKAKFEFFTTADGLPSNLCNNLLQDDQGFIWFLNNSKICRYDGRNFWTPPPPDSLRGADELLKYLTSYQDMLLFELSDLLFAKASLRKENLKNILSTWI